MKIILLCFWHEIQLNRNSFSQCSCPISDIINNLNIMLMEEMRTSWCSIPPIFTFYWLFMVSDLNGGGGGDPCRPHVTIPMLYWGHLKTYSGIIFACYLFPHLWRSAGTGWMAHCVWHGAQDPFIWNHQDERRWDTCTLFISELKSCGWQTFLHFPVNFLVTHLVVPLAQKKPKEDTRVWILLCLRLGCVGKGTGELYFLPGRQWL